MWSAFIVFPSFINSKLKELANSQSLHSLEGYLEYLS